MGVMPDLVMASATVIAKLLSFGLIIGQAQLHLHPAAARAAGDDVAGGGDGHAEGLAGRFDRGEMVAVVLRHHPVGELLKKAAVLHGEHVRLAVLPAGQKEVVLCHVPAGEILGEHRVTGAAEAGRMLGASSEADYEPISSGSGTAVVYDLSGLSFSPQIKVEGDTDEDALIRKLRDLEPEFIDFILEALSRREGGAYVTADSRLY